jgi:hypothetical protein
MGIRPDDKKKDEGVEEHLSTASALSHGTFHYLLGYFHLLYGYEVCYKRFKCSGRVVYAYRLEGINFDRGIIEVRRSATYGTEELKHRQKPPAGQRAVYVDTVTLQMLREHLAGRRADLLFQNKIWDAPKIHGH